MWKSEPAGIWPRILRILRSEYAVYDSLVEEINNVSPFHPVRTMDEARAMIPVIDDEVSRFRRAVVEGNHYLDQEISNYPFHSVLFQQQAADNLCRCRPYIAVQGKYEGSPHKNNKLARRLLSQTGDFVKQYSEIAYKAAGSIMPDDSLLMKERQKLARKAEEEATKLMEELVPKMIEGLFKGSLPPEAEELKDKIERNIKISKSARAKYTDLAAFYHALNMRDYLLAGVISHLVRAENPYAPIIRLSRQGINVLNFAEFGEEKLMINIPVQHNGKPVWAVYIEGSQQIGHYHDWMGSMALSASPIHDGVVFPYEIRPGIPHFY